MIGTSGKDEKEQEEEKIGLFFFAPLRARARASYFYNFYSLRNRRKCKKEKTNKRFFLHLLIRLPLLSSLSVLNAYCLAIK